MESTQSISDSFSFLTNLTILETLRCLGDYHLVPSHKSTFKVVYPSITFYYSWILHNLAVLTFVRSLDRNSINLYPIDTILDSKHMYTKLSSNIICPYNFSLTRSTPEIYSKFQADLVWPKFQSQILPGFYPRPLFVIMAHIQPLALTYGLKIKLTSSKINISKHFSHNLIIIQISTHNIKKFTFKCFDEVNLQVALLFIKQKLPYLKHPKYIT